MSTIACASCGAQTPEAFAYYAEEGQVCSACHDRVEVHAGFASGYRNYAYGALGLALLSVIVNPLFLISIAAIGSAFSALVYPSRLDSEDRAALRGLGHVPVVAVLALGVAIALPVLRVIALLVSGAA